MIPNKIWIEQCKAARGIEDEFGVPNALDYLIGEKFLNFLAAADGDAEFRVELPAFVAEIKTIFEPWQLIEYLEKARQTKPFDSEIFDDDDDIDDDGDIEDDDDDIELERRLDPQKNLNDLLLVELAKEWLLGD